MCVFLGGAMKFFFGPSIGGDRPPPVDPPLVKTGQHLSIHGRAP